MKAGIISNSPLSIPLLQFLVSNGIKVSVFAAVEDRFSFAELEFYCLSVRIPLAEQGNDPSSLYFWMSETDPDLIFMMGYRHLIDLSLIPLRQRGKVFNIHFGPLPAYRGPSPLFWQLKNGERSLSLTIHELSARYDEGRTVWRKELKTEPYFSYGTSGKVLSAHVPEGSIHVLQHLIASKALPAIADQGESRYYKRPVQDDVTIRWEQMSAQQIVNLVNACNPWNKGAITYHNSHDLKVLDASVYQDDKMPANAIPGTIIRCTQELLVCCRNNEILSIQMLNIQGTFVPARFVKNFGIREGDCFK